MMRDPQRLGIYAERFLQRHAMTEFPTVARAAKSLRWPQARVEQACEDSGYVLALTAYYTVTPQTLGEHFVEVIDENLLATLR